MTIEAMGSLSFERSKSHNSSVRSPNPSQTVKTQRSKLRQIPSPRLILRGRIKMKCLIFYKNIIEIKI